MYSPMLSDDLIEKLYRIKEATKIPMTKLLDGIVRDALEDVEVEVYGGKKTEAYRLQVRGGKTATWLHNGKQKGGDPQQEMVAK
ncbi:MAG: hypothetical protein HY730_02435 [Candidatus Tectomicrobia bacterium]|uniref:Uncharacterized protein n=1 Tax=Tectimicrobiota bacterium TaxID=2528274 RepID=A0A933LQD6_UNCTE|nr:hypothetical protein [Candidatus Tectomicrobia bacterium]